MRKILAALALFTLIITSCADKKGETIQIGVIAPLTGYASLPGQMCLKGIDLAKEQLTSEGKKYEFIIEDCKSSAKDAISAFRRLYSQGVKYYVVCGGQFAMAVAPLTKDKDVMMFATATANLDLLSTTNRCFRMFPHPQTVVNTLADYATNDLKLSRPAIVFLQNDAYALYGNLYEENMKQAGTTVVMKEGHPTNMIDFKDLINKIISHNPDYVFLSSMGESAITFSKQMISNPQTKSTPIIGDMNFSLPSAKQILGDYQAPIYYVDAIINDSFKETYNMAYAEDPNAYSYYSYIIPFILDETINAGNDTILEQLEYIQSNEFKIESDSPIKFDNTGEVNLELGIYKLQK